MGAIDSSTSLKRTWCMGHSPSSCLHLCCCKIRFRPHVKQIETHFIEFCNSLISSIGVAGVPGGAMVTTMMLLQSLGTRGGLSLILAPDRILDMCRTVTNITRDAVTVMIASSAGELVSRGHEKLMQNEDR